MVELLLYFCTYQFGDSGTSYSVISFFFIANVITSVVFLSATCMGCCPMAWNMSFMSESAQENNVIPKIVSQPIPDPVIRHLLSHCVNIIYYCQDANMWAVSDISRIFSREKVASWSALLLSRVYVFTAAFLGKNSIKWNNGTAAILLSLVILVTA